MTLYLTATVAMLALASAAVWTFLKSAEFSTAWPEQNSKLTKWAHTHYKWLMVVALLAAAAHLVFAIACGYTTFGHLPGTFIVALLVQPCLRAVAD